MMVKSPDDYLNFTNPIIMKLKGRGQAATSQRSERSGAMHQGAKGQGLYRRCYRLGARGRGARSGGKNQELEGRGH